MPLYKLTSPSGKSYIGITKGPLQARLNRHRFDSERGSRGKLHTAIRKHGFENFKIEVLHDSIDPDELCELEIAAIRDLNTFGKGGYNLTLGGEGALGTKLTEERKVDLVQSRARRKLDKTDEELALERARRVASGIRSYTRNQPGYDHAEKIAEARANRTPEQVAAEKANRSAAAKARWASGNFRKN